MIKVIADDKIPFLDGALESKAKVLYVPGSEMSKGMVKDADALITRTRSKCDAALLEGSQVRLVATATIGYDHIDTAYCESHGVAWTNAPGCNSSSVCQYVVAALLALSMRFGINLRKKTLGVIGVGNVGAKVARAGRLLGMKVLVNDPPRARAEMDKSFVSLDELLEQADFVTLHVPLTADGIDKTLRMADPRFLDRMKYGSFLFNSSRGPVVDPEALKEALARGKLAGAVLDVWDREPEVDRKLLSLLNLATPHIAGYSIDGKAMGTSMCVQAVSKFFGLGLGAWYPADVPAPPTPLIELDGTGKGDLDIFHEAVRHSYDIEAEDARFRSSPETFEAQRGNYPFRREFPAYSLNVKNCSSTVMQTLMELGFRVVES